MSLPGHKVRFESPPSRVRRPHPGGRGRVDFVPLFGRLRDHHGVRKIFHLVVSEDPGRPHSDSAIQKSLGFFDVEILDWAKLNLCPDTILRGAPNVRSLTLHWSGSSVTLRAWSQPDALPRLSRLRRLLVRIDEDPVEDRSTLRNTIFRFRHRMSTLRSDISVRFRRSNETDPEAQWFESVEMVAEKMWSLGGVDVPKVKMAILAPDLDLFRNPQLPTENFKFVDLSWGISDANDFVIGPADKRFFNAVIEAVFRLAPFSHITFYRVPLKTSGGSGRGGFSMPTLITVSFDTPSARPSLD